MHTVKVKQGNKCDVVRGIGRKVLNIFDTIKTCIIFISFNLQLRVFQVQFCCFRIGISSARNYRVYRYLIL